MRSGRPAARGGGEGSCRPGFIRHATGRTVMDAASPAATAIVAVGTAATAGDGLLSAATSGAAPQPAQSALYGARACGGNRVAAEVAPLRAASSEQATRQCTANWLPHSTAVSNRIVASGRRGVGTMRQRSMARRLPPDAAGGVAARTSAPTGRAMVGAGPSCPGAKRMREGRDNPRAAAARRGMLMNPAARPRCGSSAVAGATHKRGSAAPLGAAGRPPVGRGWGPRLATARA